MKKSAQMIESTWRLWTSIALFASSLGLTLLMAACGGGGDSQAAPPASIEPPPYVPPSPLPPIVMSLDVTPVVGPEYFGGMDWNFLYAASYDCVVNSLTNQRCHIPASDSEYKGAIQAWVVLAGDALYPFSFVYTGTDDILEGGVSVTWHGHDFVFPLTTPTAMLLACTGLRECSFRPTDFVMDFGPSSVWVDPTSGTTYTVGVDNDSAVGAVPLLRIRYSEYTASRTSNRHYLYVDGDFFAQ